MEQIKGMEKPNYTAEEKRKFRELEEEMKKLTPAERENLRNEKQKELDELMNLDNM